VDARGICQPTHPPPEGIDLAHDVPLTHASDARVAAQLTDLVQVHGDKQGGDTEPCGRVSRFYTGVPAPNNNDACHGCPPYPSLGASGSPGLPTVNNSGMMTPWRFIMPIRKRLSPDERRERRRRAVQRSKFALPSAITLTSVACGFASVVMSLDAPAQGGSHSHFVLAAVLLVAAAVFDTFDGMVARATNTATEFGVQLDSLADVLSFGMAPAILAYRFGFHQLGQSDPQLRAVGWAASFFFLACGALRLARFNVQAGTTDSRFFVGMPIPTGAACVAAVVLFFDRTPATPFYAYLFAAELFAVGLLMVSTVRFPSVKKLPANLHARLYTLVTFVGLLCLLIIFPRKFFLGFFGTYVLASLAMNAAWLLGWRGIQPPDAPNRVTPEEA